MRPTKIVVIGAGSASFGLGNLGNILGCEALKGSTLALVDVNAEGLKMISALAERANREWDAGFNIESSTDRGDVLPGAEFVILSIAVDREERWKLDYEIPLKHGIRHYAENGGPGAFAHTARNIPIVMDILGDMEKLCPDAWLINFTNPVPRICIAARRYSKIKTVGLCHQIGWGFIIVGAVLTEKLGIKVPKDFKLSINEEDFSEIFSVAEQSFPKLDIKAAGLNHFTWMLDIRSCETGENLYPVFAEKLREMDPSFEPLSREMFDAFGIFPVPGDGHMSEYLPWCHDPIKKPWEKYALELYDWDMWARKRDETWERIEAMAEGSLPIDKLREQYSERAVEVITGILGNLNSFELALNLPNEGYITNLPEGAIVEVPGIVSALGPRGLGVGPLPEPVAELCRRQIAVAELSVEAAVKGDKKVALQALLMDNMVNDIDTAKAILEDFLKVHAKYLPQFA